MSQNGARQQLGELKSQELKASSESGLTANKESMENLDRLRLLKGILSDLVLQRGNR